MKKFKSEIIKSKFLLRDFYKKPNSNFKFLGLSHNKKEYSIKNIFNKLFKKDTIIEKDEKENTYKNGIENNDNFSKDFIKKNEIYETLKKNRLESKEPEINIQNNHLDDNINNLTNEKKSLQILNDIKSDSIDILKQKYEIYNNYEKTSIIQKDQEFGEVVKYEDFLDKGLDKFENTLSKYYNNNNSLEKNENYQNLSKIIDEKSKLLYSNYKEEYKYNLAPNEERWYKEAIYSKANNDYEFIKIADNMKKRSNPIRNRTEFAEVIESTAKAPFHPQYPLKIETPYEKFIDPFQYLFNRNTKETKRFLIGETQYKNKITFKYNHIYEEILSEFTERNLLSPKCAFQINENSIIFQKEDDELSLYSVDSDTIEPIQRGFISNDIKAEELLELDELNEKAEKKHLEEKVHKQRKGLFENIFNDKNKNNKNLQYDKNNFEIKQIFELEDLVNLNFFYTDLGFLDFSKRLLEKLDSDETGLENFEICPKNNYLFLFFDVSNNPVDSGENQSVEMNSANNSIKENLNTFNFESDSSSQSNKQYDILIKDLKNNILLPIVLHNCNIDIAFDDYDGVFYCQKDFSNRFSKIFRHQIGKAQRNDKLIYHEKNKNFKVSTYNCNSKEYVYLEISTVTSPKVNEIWFKPANDLDKVDFLCFKKIEKNVNYKLKYSNNSFYMLTNKTDSYDKILKKIVWSKNNSIAGILEQSIVKKDNLNSNNHSDKSKSKISNEITYKSESNEIINLNNQIESTEKFTPSPITVRDDIASESQKNEISDIYTDIAIYDSNPRSLIKSMQDLIRSDDNINIIDFQVFKNYIAVLEEVDRKRQIKIINLKTNNSYIHEPEKEKNLILFSENFNFNSNYLRYIQSSPINSHTVIDYSMGTRKTYKIHKNFYSKIDYRNYESEIVDIPDREKQINIPVHLFYNKLLYNSESPIILYTKGSQGRKQDFEFDPILFSLLDRGFVWAIPQIRGTKFFDFDWYSQGISENKIKHFTDFIDVGMHFLDNKISERIILYGDGYSGGVTATVAFLQNPEDYSFLIANNGAFDILDLCMYGSNNIQILEEFGDIRIKEFYELIKMFSPYHSVLPEVHKPILLCSEEQGEYFPHAMKLAAKLRNNNKRNKFQNEILFESFEDKFTYEEKIAFIYSQLVGNLYFN